MVIECQEARESDRSGRLAASRSFAKPRIFSKTRQESRRLSLRRCLAVLSCPPRNLSQNRHKDQIALIAAIVAVRVFIQVSLQVLLADGVIYAADPALDERPKAFDGIGVSIAHHIDFCAVMNALVMVTLAELFDASVGSEFIGVDRRLWQDVLTHHAHQGLGLYVTRGLCDYAAFALHDSNDGRLLWIIRARAASGALDARLAALPKTWTPTEIGFIHLDCGLDLEVLRQKRADLLEHAPRGFVSDAGFALDLLGGDAAAGRTHQVHRVEPRSQRRGCLFQNRSGQWVDVPAASFAGISRTPRNAMMLLIRFARLAVRDAIRPALFFDVLKTGVVVRKLAVEVLEAIPQVLRYRLLYCDLSTSGHDLLCRICSLLSRDNCEYH